MSIPPAVGGGDFFIYHKGLKGYHKEHKAILSLWQFATKAQRNKGFLRALVPLWHFLIFYCSFVFL
jgi:hypothetical protein